MRWQNSTAPGGVWIDTVKVSEDGKTYKGTNQSNVPISGEKLRP